MQDYAARSPVRAAFHDQAELCNKFGSDFTAQLLRGIERILTPKTRFGARILSWKGDPSATADALPLRAAGALHALARSNREPLLTAVYPPHSAVGQDALEYALEHAISVHDAELASWLDQAPQTNEVGRSAVLYAGMMTIAERTGFPLSIFEIGASAGLNLIPDWYAYKLNSLNCGNLRSPLTLAPDWTGPPPQGSAPKIIARRGCDLAPIDVTCPNEVARLAAYIWPDQPNRIRYLDLAVELIRKDPPVVDRMDALDWVHQHINLSANAGTVRVLFHSLVFSYLPEASRVAITEHMERIGRSSTEKNPLAWLTFELDRKIRPHLKLRLWPSGHEEILASADPHVRSICWLRG